MKTKIILPLVCCLLFLIVTNFSFSQAPSENNYLNKTVAMSVGRETTIPNSGNSTETNKKIQKSFTRNFSGVIGETWSIAGNNFHCSFYMKGIPACVLFSKNGYLIYAITYGAEKDMPTDIRKIVKSEYYDYKISTAMEVKQNEKDIWVINMKDDSTHIIVRVEDGEMELVDQFKEPSKDLIPK